MPRFPDARFEQLGPEMIVSAEKYTRPDKEPGGLSLFVERLRGIERSKVDIIDNRGQKIGEQRITRKKIGKDKETKQAMLEERSEFVDKSNNRVAITISTVESSTGRLVSFRREDGEGRLLRTAKVGREYFPTVVSDFNPEISEVDPVAVTEFDKDHERSVREFEFIYIQRDEKAGRIQRYSSVPKGELPEGVEKLVLKSSETIRQKDSDFRAVVSTNREFSHDDYGRVKTEKGQTIIRGRAGDFQEKDVFVKKHEHPTSSIEVVRENRKTFKKEVPFLDCPDSETDTVEKFENGKLVEVNSQSYTYRETILYDVPEDDRAKLRFVEAERQRGRKIWLEETGSQRKTVKEIVKEKEYASTQTYRYDDQGRLMYQKAFDRVLTFEYGKKGTEPARITVYKESGEKEGVWRLRKKDDGPQPEKDRLNATSRVIIISSYKYVKE